MKRMLGLACVAAVLSAPSYAGTLGEEAKIVIKPINETDFEVIEDVQTLPRGFWCGAANYVEVRTNRSQMTPIYLKSARGPSVTTPGRNGVVFTTSPAGLPEVGQMLTVDVNTPGQSMQSYQARGFCRDAFTRATK